MSPCFRNRASVDTFSGEKSQQHIREYENVRLGQEIFFFWRISFGHKVYHVFPYRNPRKKKAKKRYEILKRLIREFDLGGTIIM